MDKFRNYDIAFSGLKTGKHQFKFEVKQAFFDLFTAEQEFTNANIEVDVTLEKHTTFLEFYITTQGNLQLVCDISNENFEYPFEHNLKVLVKYGENYDDSNEDVITIPHSDSAFNIAQLIYEATLLSVPMKKLAPNLAEDNTYQNLLEKYSPKIIEDKEEEIDPRWEALKKLKK